MYDIKKHVCKTDLNSGNKISGCLDAYFDTEAVICELSTVSTDKFVFCDIFTFSDDVYANDGYFILFCNFGFDHATLRFDPQNMKTVIKLVGIC